MAYPIEAEQPIIDALNERPGWIHASPVAIATTALSALEAAGWGIVYPQDFPGLCSRCRRKIEPGTVHRPFNGNQMFACEIVRLPVAGADQNGGDHDG